MSQAHVPVKIVTLLMEEGFQGSFILVIAKPNS